MLESSSKCNNTGRICKSFTFHPLTVAPPNNLLCLTVNNEQRISWIGDNSIYNYNYKDGDELISGLTRHKSLNLTSRTKHSFVLHVKACTNCSCSNSVSVNCEMNHTSSTKLKIILLSVGVLVLFIFVLSSIILICYKRLRALSETEDVKLKTDTAIDQEVINYIHLNQYEKVCDENLNGCYDRIEKTI